MEASFWKNIYEREWDHRGSINGALTIPVGAITVLGSAVYYMGSGFTYSHSLLTYIFIVLSSLAYISLGFAVYFVIKAEYGYTYSRIPTAEIMKKQIAELKGHYESSGGSAEQAISDFEYQLEDLYIQAAEKNAMNNDTKSAYMHKCKNALIFLIAFSALAAPISILGEHTRSSDELTEEVGGLDVERKQTDAAEFVAASAASEAKAQASTHAEYPDSGSGSSEETNKRH